MIMLTAFPLNSNYLQTTFKFIRNTTYLAFDQKVGTWRSRRKKSNILTHARRSLFLKIGRHRIRTSVNRFQGNGNQNSPWHPNHKPSGAYRKAFSVSSVDFEVTVQQFGLNIKEMWTLLEMLRYRPKVLRSEMILVEVIVDGRRRSQTSSLQSTQLMCPSTWKVRKGWTSPHRCSSVWSVDSVR